MFVCTYIHEPTHATRTRRANEFFGATIPPERCAIECDFRTTRTSASGPIPLEDGPRFGKILCRQIDARGELER